MSNVAIARGVRVKSSISRISIPPPPLRESRERFGVSGVINIIAEEWGCGQVLKSNCGGLGAKKEGGKTWSEEIEPQCWQLRGESCEIKWLCDMEV